MVRSHVHGVEHPATVGGVLPDRFENHSTHSNLIVSDLHLDELDQPDGSGWDLQGDARPEIFR